MRLPLLSSFIAVNLGLSACNSLPRIAVDHCEMRKAETKIPLEQRIQTIEDRLFSDFYYPAVGLISHFNERNAQGIASKGPLQLEQNAHLLIALANKYQVTKDAQTMKRAQNVVDGFVYLDNLHKLDGYLPMEVQPTNEGVKVLKKNTPSFGYTQLLYAYVIAKDSFKSTAVSTSISEHAKLIFQRLANDNFIIKNDEGEEIAHSDASPSNPWMLTSIHLKSLAFATAGRYLVDKKQEPDLWESLHATERKLRFEFGYDTKPSLLKVNLGIYRVPTPSSSWLDLMKLAIIYHTTKHEKYAKDLVDLAKSYSDDKNPFFIVMQIQHDALPPSQKIALATIASRRLQSYPLTNTSQEVSNVTGAPLRLIPRFVKNQAEIETTEPLPLWAMSGDTYQWKRNPYRAQGNIGEDGSKIFNAVDLYEVYWMLESQLKTIQSTALSHAPITKNQSYD